MVRDLTGKHFGLLTAIEPVGKNKWGNHMKTIGRIKWGAVIRLLIDVALGIALVCGFLAMFIGAALQESYRLNPPTAEELVEDPALAAYVEADE